METRHARAWALVAIVACSIGIVAAPFHAAAYLATESGAESPPIVPWVGAFRGLVGGALTFGTPDEVYVAYGKLAWVGVAGMLVGALVLHARQRQAELKLERRGHAILAAGLSLVAVGAIVEYYTPFLEAAFMFLSGPGALVTLIGYVVFGLGTRKAGLAPKAAWVFILAPVIVVAMVALFGHIPIAFAPIEATWIALMARVLRG